MWTTTKEGPTEQGTLRQTFHPKANEELKSETMHADHGRDGQQQVVGFRWRPQAPSSRTGAAKPDARTAAPKEINASNQNQARHHRLAS
jgi:hypothetical protein